MVRNFRNLGALTLAALAMSALVAISAQASVKGMFTAGLTVGQHTESTIHGAPYGGEPNNFFELEGLKGSCEDKSVTFTGTSLTGTDKTMTLTPHYKDCTSSKMPVTISMNGCDYLLRQPTKLDIAEFTGSVGLVCPAGKTVVIQVFLFGTITSHSVKVCEFTLEPFEILNHILYFNEENKATGKDDLTVRFELEKIPYERQGACGAKATKNDGKYVSSVTITAKGKDGTPHDLWISEEGE
jgi:hypothetical protein